VKEPGKPTAILHKSPDSLWLAFNQLDAPKDREVRKFDYNSLTSWPSGRSVSVAEKNSCKRVPIFAAPESVIPMSTFTTQSTTLSPQKHHALHTVFLQTPAKTPAKTAKIHPAALPAFLPQNHPISRPRFP
jgi:hypothetical protein